MLYAPARGPRAAHAPEVADALDLLEGGEILSAFAAAERLRRRGAVDASIADELIGLLDTGDSLAAMLSLHALSAVQGHRADGAILLALGEADLREQAAWAFARRAIMPAALAPLASIVAAGGFAAMPAQIALERWGVRYLEHVERALQQVRSRCASSGGWARLTETLATVGEPLALGAPSTLRPRASGGIGVAQILLRGQVDGELERAGTGDGGGVVTQLVQLARELGRRPEVARSVLIARPAAETPAGDEQLGPNSRIVRLPFGPDERVAVSAMWEYRARTERALGVALSGCGPIDVAHLRYADAGTFAASRALRKAGVRTVFTLAPDPHALIAEGARTGRLTRASFADAEGEEHNLFRLRLVDDLTTRADQLVTLPRAGGRPALERLVGRRLTAGRSAEIAEGIALEPIVLARGRDARRGPEAPIAADLRSAVANLGPDRLGLPLIISVGRFHPVKGFPRLVEAWGGDAELAARFNLVLVGGDLDAPTPGEQVVQDEIHRVASSHPDVRSGLVLLGARRHADVADLLAIGQKGLPGAVAPGGIYACASAKEEFGVAILEALATGLPVVAPAGGGPGSYVEQGVIGVLVAPGSVGHLRAGLHEAASLARDEVRSARAAALVRERFSIEPMAAALTTSYLRAVAR